MQLKCINDSTAVTVVIMMVSGGEQGGGFSSSHLNCFKRVELQIVKTVCTRHPAP